MANETKEDKKFLEKARQNYRLVVMNIETFEEIGSYRLSLLNVYILISSIVVLVALVVASLIVFTPIKRYIPGYGDVKQQSELMRLNKELMAMEEQLKAQAAYTENFRKILVGEVETETENNANDQEIPDSLLNVDRIMEDELLRKEVELNDQLYERELLSKKANYQPRELSLEQIFFATPISGIVSAEFELGKKHLGVDIMAPKNTPVKAIMDGFVFTSDWVLETGNTIGIQHANNLISFYKHNSALLKKTGSYVKAGEAVAIIGNTGTLSNGPHLHFELWHNGKPVNPRDYIIFD